MINFYRSEAARYELGNLTSEQATKIAVNFWAGIKNANKIHEAVPVSLTGRFGYIGMDYSDELPLETDLRYGSLSLEVELMYTGREGNLLVALIEKDQQGRRLEHPTTGVKLASFGREDGKVFLNIHPLHQIGVDPKFLTELGEKYGTRVGN
jgi:hypothetical protein